MDTTNFSDNTKIEKILDALIILDYFYNMTTPLDAINQPQNFIKFSATRNTNRTGTRDSGTFQIHSSTRLFSVFAVKQPDGSVIGNYHGDESARLRLQKEKADKLAFLCSMYNVGGQSLTCDDGTKLQDGSWLYKGDYTCWND
jgi:hypothetical protein